MMINNTCKRAISLAVIVTQMLWLAAPALAEYKPTEAKINFMKGQVEVQKSQGITWAKASVKMKLLSGDKISTEDGAEAEIVLEDGSVLKMKDKSLLLIQRMEKQKKPSMSVVNSLQGPDRQGAGMRPQDEFAGFQVPGRKPPPRWPGSGARCSASMWKEIPPSWTCLRARWGSRATTGKR